MMPLVLGAPIFGEIIGPLIFVLAIVSWIVNTIQNSKTNANQAPQKPKPQSSQSEIEALLRELSVNKPKPPTPKPQPEKRDSPSRPPKPPNDRSRQKQALSKQNPPAKPNASASRVSDEKLPSANLGAAVRTHQLGNKVEVAVERDIRSAVQHDLGNRIAPAAPRQEEQVHPLVQILRDSKGVRQAILLNEILQRPKGLRR